MEVKLIEVIYTYVPSQLMFKIIHSGLYWEEDE